MPRVTKVDHARKSPGQCGRCSVKIKIGEPYYWWKFRFGGKHVRCIAHYPRQSELTSSDKKADLYAAQEGLEDSIAEVKKALSSAVAPTVANFARPQPEPKELWAAAFKAIIQLKGDAESCKDSAQEVADQYNESADNIEQTFSSSPTADLCRESAENIEAWTTGELDSVGDNIDQGLDDFHAAILKGIDTPQVHKAIEACDSDEAKRDDEVAAAAYAAVIMIGYATLALPVMNEITDSLEDIIDGVESACSELSE